MRVVGACRRALQRPAASCAHTTHPAVQQWEVVSGQPDRGWRWRWCWYGGWALRATHNAQAHTTHNARAYTPIAIAASYAVGTRVDGEDREEQCWGWVGGEV